MIIDLHIHSLYSPCSGMSFEDILRQAKYVGLDGLCITDHNTIEIQDHLTEGLQNNGLYIFFGMEYETKDGDFLIFGPYENITPQMDTVSLLTHVNKTGGVAISAHPFRENRSTKEYILKNELCSIMESINGRNTDIENLRTTEWQRKYSLTEVGGSDAHLPGEIGCVATRFSTLVQSREDLISALKSGHCFPESMASGMPMRHSK